MSAWNDAGETPDEVDEDALAEAAEQVRAHLVVLRGGAPFLSPFDAQLLLEWLRGGVPVPVILRALEQAAERRRAKRSRVPLSLKSARTGVKKAMTRRLPTIAADPGGGAGGDFGALVEDLRGRRDPELSGVAEELSRLSGQGEALLEGALAVARRYFERAWDRADQDALLIEAEGELGGLAELMGEAALGRAREEVARDILRRRTPELSASRLWDTVVS